MILAFVVETKPKAWSLQSLDTFTASEGDITTPPAGAETEALELLAQGYTHMSGVESAGLPCSQQPLCPQPPNSTVRAKFMAP
jgi:hypothetical protein